MTRSNQLAYGTVTAVSGTSLTVDLEANTESVPAVALYLGPQVGDRAVLLGGGQSWVAMGATNAPGAPLVKIGDRVVSQVIANSTNDVCEFDASDVVVDTHGWAVPASDHVLPDIEGWYRVAASCRSTGTFTIGERLVLGVRVGGSTIAAPDFVHGGSARIGGSVATVVYCNGTTDDIDVVIFQTSGGGATFEWSYSVELVRGEA